MTKVAHILPPLGPVTWAYSASLLLSSRQLPFKARSSGSIPFGFQVRLAATAGSLRLSSKVLLPFNESWFFNFNKIFHIIRYPLAFGNRKSRPISKISHE